jgi:hypothetical protein
MLGRMAKTRKYAVFCDSRAGMQHQWVIDDVFTIAVCELVMPARG